VGAGSEAEARGDREAVNEDIREENRRAGIAGPAIMLMPLDVDRVLEEWRASR